MNITSSIPVSVNDSNNASSALTLKLFDIKVYSNPIGFVFQIVYMAIGAVGITGNLLALIVFLRHKPLFKRPANYYLASQCTINLLVSIVLILTIAVDASHWPPTVVAPMCYLWNSRAVFVGLFLASICNITLMTVERYLEVVHPIKHHLKISKDKVIASIIAGTLFGVIFKLCIACPSVKVVSGICTSASYSTVAVKRVVGVANFLVEYFIPVAVIAFCYASMALSLRRSVKISHSTDVEPHRIETKISRARRNIVKTLFIVVLSFIVCTTFKQVMLLFSALGDMALDLSGVTFNAAQVLAYLNCCNDPFIYAFHYGEFRIGLRKLFGRVRVRPSGSSTIQVDTCTHAM